MLVDQAVTGIVPDHFDGDVELIFTTHAVAQCGHFRSALNRIGPHKHGNTCFNRVIQRRHALKRQRVRAFTRAGIPAVDSNVAG